MRRRQFLCITAGLFQVSIGEQSEVEWSGVEWSEWYCICIWLHVLIVSVIMAIHRIHPDSQAGRQPRALVRHGTLSSSLAPKPMSRRALRC